MNQDQYIKWLWHEYQDSGDEHCRNVLMEHYLYLVKYTADRVFVLFSEKAVPGHSVTLDDLVQAGLFGLIDSVETFDPDDDITFERFAVPRIRSSILDELRSMERIPRLIRAHAHQLHKQHETNSKKNKHQVTETEYPGLTHRSIGPIQGMRPNCCAVPQWVIQYGLPRLRELLAKYNVLGHQYEWYIGYFQELWECGEATPTSKCHPYILKKVEEFTEELRTIKRSIFGE